MRRGFAREGGVVGGGGGGGGWGNGDCDVSLESHVDSEGIDSLLKKITQTPKHLV